METFLCVLSTQKETMQQQREKKIAGNNGYNGLNGSFVNCELLQEKRTYNNKKRFIEKETEERRPKNGHNCIESRSTLVIQSTVFLNTMGSLRIRWMLEEKNLLNGWLTISLAHTLSSLTESPHNSSKHFIF